MVRLFGFRFLLVFSKLSLAPPPPLLRAAALRASDPDPKRDGRSSCGGRQGERREKKEKEEKEKEEKEQRKA